MNTQDENTLGVFAHIKQSVQTHQIPDLTLVKSLFQQRKREHQEKLNALEFEIQQCVHRAENAASAMYQRHYYAADNSVINDVVSPYHPFNQEKE
ncbi:hypothetical protein [Pseudoalteromonas sp. JC28]|uniref:hypothetical protein n=1 Tax=Pseudoalteromonas sp. JC28 TaxID=2267617 RepID=UPI001572E2AC|nr:hypothetical protein [Pseudoalteromonas sp. JC28]